MPPSTSRSSGCSTRVSSSTVGRTADGVAQVAGRSTLGRPGRRPPPRPPPVRLPSSAPPSSSRSWPSSSSSSTSPSSTMRWSTRPESVMTHQQQPGRGQRDHLEVPHRRRDSVGYCTTATCRVSWASSRTAAAQHVVEVDPGLEERQDRAPLGRRQRLDVVEPVDELPVALVGGDAARAGVRLRDVALVLQHGHVVADGRAGHPEVVPVDQRLGADRLLGGARSRRRSRAAPRSDGRRHCSRRPPPSVALISSFYGAAPIAGAVGVDVAATRPARFSSSAVNRGATD